VIALGEVDRLEIAVAVRAPQRDHAEILHERGHEGLVGIAAAHEQRDLARGRGAVDGATPVVEEVEAHLVVAAAVDRTREAEAKHERLHGLQSEERERLLDRSATAREAVEARVHRADHLGRDGGIVLDHRRDLAQRHVGLRGQFKHLHRHDGKRREIRC
jgi:hypothetical protein